MEKSTSSQADSHLASQEFPAVYGTRMFITVLRRAR